MPWVIVSAVLAMIAGGIAKGAPPPPVQDSEFYVRLALGVSEFGVLGRFTSPDLIPEALGSAPLYPAFLALLAQVDSGFRESLICSAASGPSSGCQPSFWVLVVVQGGLMALCLVCIWLTAQLLTGRRLVAWLAMAAAILSGIPAHYAGQFLTEALVLPLFALLTLFLLLAWRRPNAALWPLLMGLTVGLLALTRPTYAYLFWYLTAMGTISIAFAAARKRVFSRLLLFGLAYGLVTLPWVVHNHLAFGTMSIDARGYGGMTLAQRVSYNRMSAGEWGVAFLYWFPDVGDHLTERFFAPRLYERLGGGGESYYRIGAGELTRDTIIAAGSKGNHVSYLVRTEILAHPVKHAMVTLPLAWRGMFISKYWGIAGWICALWLLLRSLRRREWDYPVLFLPPAFLVVFHAAVSVSIPRYNIVLLPVLSIALAVALVHLSWRITQSLRTRSMGKG